MTFKRMRALFGAGILVLISIGALWGIGFGTFCYLHIGIIRLICPVGFFELCLSNRTVYWELVLPFLIVMGLVFLLGRTFCSWACPVGLVFDWFDRVLTRILPAKVNGCRIKFTTNVLERLPQLGYKDGIAIMIGAFAGIALFKYPFVSTFCPIGVVTRNVVSLFAHFQLHGDLVFLLLAVPAGYLFANGFRDCCPVGMLQSVVAKSNRLFVPKVNEEKCKHCGMCEKVCPVDLCISKDHYDTSVCCKCLTCIDNCPNKALYLSSFGVKKHGKSGGSKKPPKTSADTLGA